LQKSGNNPVKIDVNETANDAYMRRLKMSQQQQQISDPPK
jgi:hypothetical protein